MPFVDDVNRILRDFEGYTGDGQGGIGALPVGDRSTSRKPITKRDLRTLLIQVAQTLGDPSALQTIIDELDAQSDAFVLHVNDSGNPHGTTKLQVGLGNVDNTSDANKPISIAQSAAFSTTRPDAGPAAWLEGAALNGATLANKTLTIPNGQTGASSYVRPWVAIPRAMAGRNVRVTLRYEATSGFLSGLTSYTASPRLRVNGAYVNASAGTTVTTVNGTSVSFEFDMTRSGAQSVEATVQFQVGSGQSNTTGTRTLELVDITWAEVESTASDTSDKWARNASLASSGDILHETPRRSTAANGASVSGSTITIPAASTGAGTYIEAEIDLSPVARQNFGIFEVSAFIDTDANFQDASTLSASLHNPTGTVYTNGGAVSTSANVVALSSTVQLVKWVVRLPASDAAVHARITVSGSSRAVQTTATVRDLVIRTLHAGADAASASDMQVRWDMDRKDKAVREFIPSRWAIKNNAAVLVDVAGAGDYTTIAAAFAAEGGGTEARPLRYDIKTGVYEEYSLLVPDWAWLQGVGTARPWIKGYLDPSTAPATASPISTLDWKDSGILWNLKVTAQNMRYPIHNDAQDGAAPRTQMFRNCHIEHFGNKEMRDWQDANGGSAASVWSSTHAVGCGTRSGMVIDAENSVFWSDTTSFYAHSNPDQTDPVDFRFEACRLIATGNDQGAEPRFIYLQPGASGNSGTITLIGCETRGVAHYINTYSLVDSAELGVSDIAQEMRVTASGGSPFSYRTQTTGAPTVLEIRSKAVSGSTVSISGGASELLFGALPIHQSGASNYAGRAYSGHIIDDAFAGCSLSERLGNMSSDARGLVLTFEGGATETLLLNSDYSSMSNAAIISSLNSQFVDAGRALYETAYPFNDAVHIRQVDHDVEVKNVGSDVILAGRAVMVSGGRYSGDVATSGSARVDVIGIARENIAPGELGVVQKSGEIHENSVVTTGTVNDTIGQTWGVGADGALITTATEPLLRTVELLDGQRIYSFV